MRALIWILLAATLLAGCASSPEIRRPTVNDPANSATLTVLRYDRWIRPFAFKFVSYVKREEVFLNALQVVRIGNCEHLTFNIEPGEHYISADGVAAIRLAASAGEHYFVVLQEEEYLPRFMQVEQTKAAPMLEKCRKLE